MDATIGNTPIQSGMRVRYRHGGSTVWTVGLVSADYVFIAEWPKSSPQELSRFWDDFELILKEEPNNSEMFVTQRLGQRNDYVPTDEDMILIHSDGSIWPEPEDMLANFKRWLEAHNERLYAVHRKEIEAELGVAPIEENQL